MSKNNNIDECSEVFNRFANKEFGDWIGIPEECTMYSVSTFFKAFSEGRGSAILGKQYVQTFFKMFVADKYDRPIRVWFREEKIVKIEADFPKIPNIYEDLVVKLGEPAVKLDYYMNVFLVNDGEWVYPGRGISLFFNPDKTELIKLSVYPPTSIQNYMDNIHFSAPVREFGE